MEKNGTVCNQNKGNSGRPPHVRTEDIIALANETIQESPSRSVRPVFFVSHCIS